MQRSTGQVPERTNSLAGQITSDRESSRSDGGRLPMGSALVSHSALC